MSVQKIRQSLESEVFPFWGLPKKMRVDNGQPFGVPDRNSISPLSLWLIGLGIKMHFNRPRIPQENAKVERNQGTTAKWSDYKKCTNYEELQLALNEACIIQRDQYPLDRNGFKTRKELFPELYTRRNKFQSNNFSIEKVLNTLSLHTYVRRVSKSNQFTFYGVQPSIPKGYAHQDIAIKLNVQSNSWQIINREGFEITQIPNNFIIYDNIMDLSIRQRTSKT